MGGVLSEEVNRVTTNWCPRSSQTTIARCNVIDTRTFSLVSELIQDTSYTLCALYRYAAGCVEHDPPTHLATQDSYWLLTRLQHCNIESEVCVRLSVSYQWWSHHWCLVAWNRYLTFGWPYWTGITYACVRLYCSYQWWSHHCNLGGGGMGVEWIYAWPWSDVSELVSFCVRDIMWTECVLHKKGNLHTSVVWAWRWRVLYW